MDNIALAAVTADSAGSVVFKATSASDFEAYKRRSSRYQTLDGAIAWYDGGFSHGDRTLIFFADYSAELWTVLFHLHSTYSEIHMSLNGGFYLVGFNALEIVNGKIKLTIWIYEKIDE